MPGADYFFYGTLMDVDVLACVSGRSRRSLRLVPARIEGYRPVCVPGATYPILVADAAFETEGKVFPGVTSREAMRLKRFEGNDYVLGRLAVKAEGMGEITAFLFLPRPGIETRHRVPWIFEDWQRCHKRAYVAHLVTGRPL